MANGHFLRTAVLIVAGLIVVGFVAVWLIQALFSLIFYLAIGVLVVGGAVYLAGRARRALGRTGQRRIGPR